MTTSPVFAWGAMRACEGADTAAPSDLRAFLGRLRDLGAAWIDVADIYADGRSEALVGEALAGDAGLARRYKLIAKAGVQFPSPARPHQRVHHYRSDAAFLTAQLDASLQRLQCERVDLFLLHRPDYLMDAAQTADTLRGFVADGKAAAVGVSNFSISQVDLLARVLGAPPAAHQLELSVLETAALDDGRLDQAQRDRTQVFAWGPLAAGRLFDADDAGARPVRAELARAAGRNDDDAAAGAALAWLARLPVRPIPILGSCRLARLEAQIAAMGATRFEPEDWYAVLEAARGVRAP